MNEWREGEREGRRDHIKLERACGHKTRVKLNGANFSKLWDKLFFSRPFSVLSRTSRSNN